MTEFNEADLDRSIARAFGRESVAEMAARPLSPDEALTVVCAAAAGTAPRRLEEAQRVLAETSAPRADSDVAAIVEEVAGLARTKLGMSPARAALHAQSEALRAREFSGSVSEAVVTLGRYRDELSGGPSSTGHDMSEARLNEVIDEAFARLNEKH